MKKYSVKNYCCYVTLYDTERLQITSVGDALTEGNQAWYLNEQKQLSDGTMMQLLCGLKAFYTHILRRNWSVHLKAPSGRQTSCFPTAVRQRFLEDLQLQGMSARTQQAYVRTVRQLADHYGKSPEHITEEELRQYVLHVKHVKQ